MSLTHLYFFYTLLYNNNRLCIDIVFNKLKLWCPGMILFLHVICRVLICWLFYPSLQVQCKFNWELWLVLSSLSDPPIPFFCSAQEPAKLGCLYNLFNHNWTICSFPLSFSKKLSLLFLFTDRSLPAPWLACPWRGWCSPWGSDSRGPW